MSILLNPNTTSRPRRVMVDKWDIAHMETAKIYAKLSSAKRLKVGCVIVKDRRIISIGYNGMPSGWDNECEYLDKEYEFFDGALKTKKEVLHAESNAIAKVARSPESSFGAVLYCTHAPCLDCAKLIHQAGIVEVWYEEEYRNLEGLRFLAECDILVRRVQEKDYESI